MSWHGRECVRQMDLAELRIQAGYWTRHSDCLTSAEKKRIARGSYNSFRRPQRPTFKNGDWLVVRRNLEIQIADVLPKRGGYRIRIGAVRDFRSTNGTPIKTYGEDRESMKNTLSISSDAPNPPEPHGPGEQWLKVYADNARLSRAYGSRSAIEE